jgi:hypothetical protein
MMQERAERAFFSVFLWDFDWTLIGDPGMITDRREGFPLPAV